MRTVIGFTANMLVDKFVVCSFNKLCSQWMESLSFIDGLPNDFCTQVYEIWPIGKLLFGPEDLSAI